MGLYCTTTSLQTAMIGSNFDTATTSLATDMISDAEAEINKYLSQRYDLNVAPFLLYSTMPPMVKTWAKWLSMAYMYNQLARGAPSDRADKLEKRALDNLLMVAEYKLNVVAADGTILAESSNSGFRVQCNTSGYTPTFAEDDEKNWKVDQDKLDDIAAERD